MLALPPLNLKLPPPRLAPPGRAVVSLTQNGQELETGRPNGNPEIIFRQTLET